MDPIIEKPPELEMVRKESYRQQKNPYEIPPEMGQLSNFLFSMISFNHTRTYRQTPVTSSTTRT